MVDMLPCHLQLKIKSKTECPYLIYRLSVKINELPLLSSINQLLLKFTHILRPFYHLLICLLLPTHFAIDAS